MCFIGAETIYKSVDENGNIIFTDKPSEDAEEIKIKELETIKNPNPGKFKPTTKQATETEAYKSFTVTNPKAGEAVRSNIGNVNISLSIEPALQRSHTIEILMDGKKVGSGSSVSLQNVDRGSHSITASVIDGNGKKLISTSSTFSILRAAK